MSCQGDFTAVSIAERLSITLECEFLGNFVQVFAHSRCGLFLLDEYSQVAIMRNVKGEFLCCYINATKLFIRLKIRRVVRKILR